MLPRLDLAVTKEHPLFSAVAIVKPAERFSGFICGF